MKRPAAIENFVQRDSRALLITKGALREKLRICGQAPLNAGSLVALETVRGRSSDAGRNSATPVIVFSGWLIAKMPARTRVTRADESDMIFAVTAQDHRLNRQTKLAK